MSVTRQRRSEISRPTGILALAAALSHPLRVRIIGAMNSPKRRYSATTFAEEIDEDVTFVAYHFRELRALGYLEVVERHRRRGSFELVYAATRRAAAWEREWKQLPPVVKQQLAALSLRMGVEAAGAAIDSGAFEARDDSVVAQDTMRLDERGANDALAVLLEAVNSLVRISEEAEGRLAKTDDEGILISYLLLGYEGEIRPI